jgi:hypothetical protein
MDMLIVAAVVAGYIVQWVAALIVVVEHTQDKTKSPPEQLTRCSGGKTPTSETTRRREHPLASTVDAALNPGGRPPAKHIRRCAERPAQF